METAQQNQHESTATDELKETKRLYRVISTVPRLTHRGCTYKDVKIIWLAERDEPPVSYEEGAIDELFTLEEAHALAAYLFEAHNDAVTIEPIVLPWNSKDTMPIGAIPLGGPTDQYMLYREPEYNLTFKVCGFFDIRGYERIQEPNHETEEQTITSPAEAATDDKTEPTTDEGTEITCPACYQVAHLALRRGER